MKIPKIKQGHEPSSEKHPRAIDEEVRKRTVQWCFGLFDKGACWHDNTHSEETFRHVAGLLKDYSSRTWGQIAQDHKRDHSVEMSQLTPAAQRRLEELRLDDWGHLW